MKLVRCKDCALKGTKQCGKACKFGKEIKFCNKDENFYCSKGRLTKEHIATNHNIIINKSPVDMAHFLASIVMIGYEAGVMGKGVLSHHTCYLQYKEWLDKPVNIDNPQETQRND